MFDTKPYDRSFFEEEKREYRFDITYFEVKLSSRTAALASGFDAVCAFVNEEIDEKKPWRFSRTKASG